MTAYYDGLYYWVKDLKGDGGSFYKVYKSVGKTFEWAYDADFYGNFIKGKHKGRQDEK